MKQATKKSFRRKTADRQKGAVAVEFAIVLPLFAILLLGTFELGSAAREHQVLQNAAREGARFSSLPTNRMTGNSEAATILATIQARVVAYLQNEGVVVPAGNIAVDQNVDVTIGALTVKGSRVTVTYNRPWIFAGATSLIALPAGTLQLKGIAVFRNFY